MIPALSGEIIFGTKQNIIAGNVNFENYLEEFHI